MKRALLICAAVATGAIAATSPKLRLSEAQDITPVRVQAELTLDPHKKDFTGVVEIQIKVNRPSSIVWLNATGIKISAASLKSSGKNWNAKPILGGDDFVGLQLDTDLPAGPADIRIQYTGVIREGEAVGIFHASDSGEDYLYTQFENTDARRAFPCFDEPFYKIPWQITLLIPERDRAVGNTPALSDHAEAGVRKIVFGETKPLPSYLVAFAVGPLEFIEAGAAGKNRTPVRIIVPKGRAPEAKYAAEVTATILTRLEDYYGIPYPYEKSDHVALPINSNGAMENAGLVTYQRSMILSKPETDSLARQRGYAIVAAHELAHHWFGDLVTTSWWDDIWLNEAFAEWMGLKLVSEWKPEWNIAVTEARSKLGAQGADSLISARKIRQEIATNGDIANAFDAITYNKGAAVIAMFENWIGPDEFRKGVRAFLQQYAFRTVTSGDFLDSLSSSSKKDVTKAFSSFLNQAGVPIVSVSLDCKDRPKLHLEQSRYLPIGSKGSAAQVWSIPVCVRHGEGQRDRECTLMSQPVMDWNLQTKSCPAWIEANDKAKGYYRVDYQGGLLEALTSGDLMKRLTAAERADLMGNAAALVAGGKLALPDALHIVETLRNDSSRQVTELGIGIAAGINRDLVSDELRPNYERFLRKNFGQRARDLGWVAKAGEDDDLRLLRPRLLSTVATLGGDETLANQARVLADTWLQDRKSVAPEIVEAVLQTAAYYGDTALYNRFLAEYQKTQDAQDKQRLLLAMSAFRDPNAIQIGFQELISGRIRVTEALPLLRAGMGWNATRMLAFQYVKSHLDELLRGNPLVLGISLGAYLPTVGTGFCDAAGRQEVADFFTPLNSKYDGAARNLARALETIDLCIAQVAAQGRPVAEFLKRY